MLLLLPYFVVSALQWQESARSVDGAVQVDVSAKRLDLLLRLAPAINKENLSISIVSGESDLASELPEAAVPVLNLDVLNSIVDDQAEVDRLLGLLDEPNLAAELEEIRQSSDDGSLGLLGTGEAYDGLLGRVRIMIEEELLILNSLASATGEAGVASAARIAEAAADVRVASVGLDTRWAQVIAAEFAPPTPEDVQDFVFGVRNFEEQLLALDAVAPVDGPLRSELDRILRSETYATLIDELQWAANGVVQNGVVTDEVSNIDLSNLDIIEAVTLAARIAMVVDAAGEVNAGLDTVTNTALVDLRLESSAAVGDALDSRRQTIWGLLGSGLLLLLTALGLAWLIGRPLRSMADAARRLSKGDLDVKLPERGPAEILVGSMALNQALSSLRTTEAQAVALAEERLDDPILEHETPGELGKSLQAAVRRLADSLADREEFRQQLAYDAAHDGLTKLANRTAVLKHLSAALARGRRSGNTTAVLFLDLDHFKSVNDSHGHHAGDEMLQTIAERLTTAIREGDLAGRLGGDEFIVVAEDVADVDEAIALSERIMAKINEPISLARTTFTPKISVGIGLSNGDLTADELLRDADLAVYRAKSRGRGVIDVCDESLRSMILERSLLESDIKVGIANNEFELYVQPVVNVSSGEHESYEALVRWHKPGDGLTFPDAFIPTAERSGLIIDLDRWVLDAACALLSTWKTDATLESRSLAINISARHLSSGMLPGSVRTAINTHGIDPRRLIVEVTETALLDDLTSAADDIEVLRSLGVRIALDDFGTGYMSLANLRSLAVDVLKIDGSFVAEVDTLSGKSMIQLIIDAGHLLDIEVTAEGVETAEQADLLRSMGADRLQGHLFGRAAPAKDLQDRIASNKAISS